MRKDQHVDPVPDSVMHAITTPVCLSRTTLLVLLGKRGWQGHAEVQSGIIQSLPPSVAEILMFTKRIHYLHFPC